MNFQSNILNSIFWDWWETHISIYDKPHLTNQSLGVYKVEIWNNVQTTLYYEMYWN